VALSPGKQIIALRTAEIDIITNETGDLLAVGGLKETSEPNVDRRIVPDVMCASTRKILHWQEPNLYSVFGVAFAYDRKPSLGRVREIPTPAPDHRRIPFRLRLSEPDEANGRVAALFGDHPRQEGDTESRSGEFDHEVDLAASSYNGWLETSPPACL